MWSEWEASREGTSHTRGTRELQKRGKSCVREAVAFSPGHITGIFRIYDSPVDPLDKGSCGAGVSIVKGVTTRVVADRAARNAFSIRINGQPTDTAMVSEHVLSAFFTRTEAHYRVTIDHFVQTPVGSGFGSSGAGALSLAVALNDVFDADLSPIEAAQVAHIAEVHCKTGLGTVIAETVGGVEMRLKPGGPGVGEVRQIPVGDDYVVACMSMGPIATSHVLGDEGLRGKINQYGDSVLQQLVEQPDPATFMKLSREFSEHVGLISPRLRKVLHETDREGATCSMAMLGETLFALVERTEGDRLRTIFTQHASADHTVMLAEIDFEGARLLD